MKFDEQTAGLPLRGLRLAPAQAFGAIRLVPLLRDHVRSDLRLGTRSFGDDRPDVVGLAGDARAPDLGYFAYVPHAMVLRFSTDGAPVAARGATLSPRKQGLHTVDGVRILHRMARAEGPGALRFLPLHLAMEGFLSLHFGGPDVMWSEYSREALTRGLSPRSETVVPGAAIAGLDDALRMFELHDAQVGALVFVADTLAAITCTPHPDDYRALHRSLVRDFYGELLYQYALCYPDVPAHRVHLDAAAIADLAGLRAAVDRGRADWLALTEASAAGVLNEPLSWQTVRTAGPFRLRRFVSALRPDDENHIGEAIVRDTGELEYCKTFRLSAAQVRRAALLGQLAAVDWHLGRAAEAQGITREHLCARLRGAGFGYLLKEHVLKDLPT